MAIECSNCGCRHCPASHSREHKIRYHGKTQVYMRRRRTCRHCGNVFYSREFSEEEKIKVDINQPQPPPEIKDPGGNPYI